MRKKNNINNANFFIFNIRVKLSPGTESILYIILNPILRKMKRMPVFVNIFILLLIYLSFCFSYEKSFTTEPSAQIIGYKTITYADTSQPVWGTEKIQTGTTTQMRVKEFGTDENGAQFVLEAETYEMPIYITVPKLIGYKIAKRTEPIYGYRDLKRETETIKFSSPFQTLLTVFPNDRIYR